MKLTGLVAATHTPFTSSGGLNLDVIARQAEHLASAGVGAVFVGGTTGESSSLTLNERLALAARWSEVVKGSALKLVVHVGSNCLADARTMAAHAQQIGAAAISAVAPCYFKPRTLDDLIACCADTAAAAPATPFYYYDIPSMTGVNLPVPAFLERAKDRIPTLAGAKFTNVDLAAYRMCLRGDGTFDVLWGLDEHLLGALAAGAEGAIGSTYNFAAPVYRRLIDAFTRNDLAAARAEQDLSIRLIEAIAAAPAGYLPAAKAVMGFIGIDVGPARLPFGTLTNDQRAALRERLDALAFFTAVSR